MRRRDPEPICCDGRCVRGEPCPQFPFAPGVVDGPYTCRPRLRQRVLGPLAYPVGVLVAVVALLLGPTP